MQTFLRIQKLLRPDPRTCTSALWMDPQRSTPQPRKFLWNELRNETVKEERSVLRGCNAWGLPGKDKTEDCGSLLTIPKYFNTNPKFKITGLTNLGRLPFSPPKQEIVVLSWFSSHNPKILENTPNIYNHRPHRPW